MCLWIGHLTLNFGPSAMSTPPQEKGYFLELNEYFLLAARTSSLGGPPVIEDLQEAPLDSKTAVSQLLNTVFPDTKKGTARAICALRPRLRFFHLAGDSETRQYYTPTALRAFVSHSPQAGTGASEIIALETSSGMPLNGSGKVEGRWIFEGSPRDSLAAMQATVHGWKLAPFRVEAATLAMLGAIHAEQQANKASSPLLVWEIGETTSDLFLISSKGLMAAKRLAFGFDKVADSVQTEMGLKSKEIAAKVFFNEFFDFSESGSKITARISPFLLPEIVDLVPAEARASAMLLCTGLPSKQAWFNDHMARSLNLTAWQPDVVGWCSCAGMSFLGNTLQATLSPVWLGLLGVMSAFQVDKPDADIAWHPVWNCNRTIPAANDKPAAAAAPPPKPEPAPIPAALETVKPPAAPTVLPAEKVVIVAVSPPPPTAAAPAPPPPAAITAAPDKPGTEDKPAPPSAASAAPVPAPTPAAAAAPPPKPVPAPIPTALDTVKPPAAPTVLPAEKVVIVAVSPPPPAASAPVPPPPAAITTAPDKPGAAAKPAPPSAASATPGPPPAPAAAAAPPPKPVPAPIPTALDTVKPPAAPTVLPAEKVVIVAVSPPPPTAAAPAPPPPAAITAAPDKPGTEDKPAPPSAASATPVPPPAPAATVTPPAPPAAVPTAKTVAAAASAPPPAVAAPVNSLSTATTTAPYKPAAGDKSSTPSVTSVTPIPVPARPATAAPPAPTITPTKVETVASAPTTTPTPTKARAPEATTTVDKPAQAGNSTVAPTPSATDKPAPVPAPPVAPQFPKTAATTAETAKPIATPPSPPAAAPAEIPAAVVTAAAELPAAAAPKLVTVPGKRDLPPESSPAPEPAPVPSPAPRRQPRAADPSTPAADLASPIPVSPRPARAATVDESPARRRRFLKTPAGIAVIGSAVMVLGATIFFYRQFAEEKTAALHAQAVAEQHAAAEAAARRQAEQHLAKVEAEARRRAEEEVTQKNAAVEAARQQAAEEARRREIETNRLLNGRGSLVIATEPAGATIDIGNLAPRVSPATVSDLRLGHYTVKISLTGYDPANLDVEIKDNEATAPGPIRLVRQTGSLTLATEPAGENYEVRPAASRFFAAASDLRQGKTPATLADLPTGEYTVIFSREGWPNHTENVVIEHNRAAQISSKFSGGSVTITSTPAGASVTRHGLKLGVTPLTLEDVQPGEASYTLEAQAYIPVDVTGRVEPEKTLRLDATLISVDRIAGTSDLDERPVPIKTVEPIITHYQEKTEGTAIISLMIDRDGTPKDLKVEQASNAQFGRRCLEAAARWRFSPGKIKGIPVKTRVSLPFNFAPP